MTFDKECVNLVGKTTLSLKVINPKYVMENTWPDIRLMDEADAFLFFHYWVSRAIHLYEIETSVKGEPRYVCREHPDEKHQVILSYDETSVKLETLGKTQVFSARFPHFVFEHLKIDMEGRRSRNALHVFHRFARNAASLYENPHSDIILDYFKDYEYPEDTYDYEETETTPTPVTTPVTTPKKSFWSRFF